MKRLYGLILAGFLLLTLSACAQKPHSSTYTVTRDDTVFTVDQQNRTISDGEHTYQFTVSGNSSGYEFEITYPDGSTYWWSVQRSGGIKSGYGGWSDDYAEGRYVAGDVLVDVLEKDPPLRVPDKNIPLILLLLAVGIFNTASPQTAWYLEHGWRYKNAEPSELALVLNRLGGIAVIIVAIIMLIA